MEIVTTLTEVVVSDFDLVETRKISDRDIASMPAANFLIQKIGQVSSTGTRAGRRGQLTSWQGIAQQRSHCHPRSDYLVRDGLIHGTVKR